MGSLPSFIVQGVTFPLVRTVFVADNRLASILCSYQPYYSGTGPNGSDPQTYAGSGNGLQAPWGNAWKFNIGSVISVFRSRLYSVKNEWDVEREARFAINGFMRNLTGRNAALSPITSTPNSAALGALGSADACISVQSTTFAEPVSIPFLTSASFRPGTSAAANARGRAAFLTLVNRASAASRLTKAQDAQLLATVYESINKATLVKKSSLTPLRTPTLFARIPVRGKR